MAKTKSKAKHGHAPRRRNGLRNADGAPRKRSPTRSPSESDASYPSRSINGDEDRETPGWKAIKTAGGALGAALACAYIARENWIPPRAVTGVVSAVGATLAVGGSKETYRDIGLGVMSAAGSQLALLTIDNHMATTAAPQTTVATTNAPARRQASLDTLPAGALESAYRRARERLAMSQAVGQPT